MVSPGNSGGSPPPPSPATPQPPRHHLPDETDDDRAQTCRRGGAQAGVDGQAVDGEAGQTAQPGTQQRPRRGVAGSAKNAAVSAAADT